MQLTGDRPTDPAGIVNFALQYCTEADCTAPYKGTGANGGTPASSDTSTTVAGLTRNTPYHFRIRAVGAKGYEDSDWTRYPPTGTLEDSA